MDFMKHEIEQKECFKVINSVLDEFSNEFLRLENFMEKYIPLKFQNTISEAFNFILPKRDLEQYKILEAKKYNDLR